MLNVYVAMRDGSVRTIEYNPHKCSAFEALESVYRGDPDFMVYDIDNVTFDM